ncbi:MAG TPA: SprT family zinc-dependent metalloprotease [Clostridia bacterium]|nr:SprT family zinc-dependent metalloprotease [Clostridia bacterium]
MSIPYRIIRSDRKTVSIGISDALQVVVRAPLRIPRQEIDRLVRQHADWIERTLRDRRAHREAHPLPSEAEAARLRQLARETLPGRVAHYAALMGLTPASIKVTSAKKRFGSCSGRNGLCFSYLLMRYPKEAIDYVVVHELAHIRHKNHSPAFHALVASILPDAAARRALLKG